jgi:hypothetical protein
LPTLFEEIREGQAVCIVLVGEPETAEFRRHLDRPILAFETLSRIRVDRGRLLVEHPNFMNHFLPIERVAYHAIFEDDFDFLTALAPWGRPCLPGARGMMDLRLRLPGLVRALAIICLGGILRGYADRGTTVAVFWYHARALLVSRRPASIPWRLGASPAIV